jgi:3-ketosteroid 9alpha-monooxygenase subunit B
VIKSALAATMRSITLVYANRDARSVIFRTELDELQATSGGRLEVLYRYDTDLGFLDATACANLIGDRTQADFYVCGPAPFMDIVEAGLAAVRVPRGNMLIERFLVPEHSDAGGLRSETTSVLFRQARRRHETRYHLGETLLETARRAGLNPPFSCQSGSCASCIAHIEEGTAVMRANNALSPAEVTQGWVLTCQAVPKTRQVVVNYDA